MKKFIRIILIISILNMILITNVFAINTNLSREELLQKCSSIVKMTDKELSNLSEENIEKDIEELKYYLNGNAMGLANPISETLTKLSNELDRRKAIDGIVDYKEYEPGKTGDSTKVESMAGNILRIVRNVGVVLAIIALTIIGIKYMVGSVEQRAEYKKSLIPFAIGVIILASSTTFVSIIYDTTTNVLSKNPTFDETLQSGEDAAREFLSMPGLRKDQLYSQLAAVSKKREDAYYTAYFNVLIEAMPNNFEDGYNKGCNEIRDTYTQGLALKSCKENFDKATDTSKKEYYAGYLLALGDTYGLIELAR